MARDKKNYRMNRDTKVKLGIPLENLNKTGITSMPLNSNSIDVSSADVSRFGQNNPFTTSQ